MEDSIADRFFFDRTVSRINKGDTVRYFVSKDELEQDMQEFGQPDLMVLDLDVPGCDGMRLLEFLREDSRYKNLPIVIYTGRESDSTRSEALEKGATRYILKADDPRNATQDVRYFIDSARQLTACQD